MAPTHILKCAPFERAAKRSKPCVVGGHISLKGVVLAARSAIKPVLPSPKDRHKKSRGLMRRNTLHRQAF
nr:MAG TPA: hypothetical protein [Caudoviricetes sp.]